MVGHIVVSVTGAEVVVGCGSDASVVVA